jgi:hypothetical protein
MISSLTNSLMYAKALTTERMIPSLTNSLMYTEALTTERMISSLTNKPVVVVLTQ